MKLSARNSSLKIFKISIRMKSMSWIEKFKSCNRIFSWVSKICRMSEIRSCSLIVFFNLPLITEWAVSNNLNNSQIKNQTNWTLKNLRFCICITVIWKVTMLKKMSLSRILRMLIRIVSIVAKRSPQNYEEAGLQRTPKMSTGLPKADRVTWCNHSTPTSTATSKLPRK